MISKVFGAIFLRGAPWPRILTKAHVVFIPKSPEVSQDPSNLRPITVLSAVYRIWSSCMFQRLLKWRDSWCPPTICGGRPGSDALQTALEIGLTVEEAIALHQRGLLLVSLDLSKFFDSIEWGLIDFLAEKFGMPTNLRNGFISFLSSLQRKFKVGGTYSEQWYPTTCGTPQGDALSILWANLSSAILAKILSGLGPGTGNRIYVDDRYI
jgi:hypothetical protein